MNRSSAAVTDKLAFHEIARTATSCRRCFEVDASLTPATVDVAQPRWVGPFYWQSSPRVLLLLLNPGAGGSANRDANLTFVERLRSFRDGKTDIAPIFDHQLQTIPTWGRPPGRFSRFYFDGLGLTLQAVALANIAWCATLDNSYPEHMLQRCFKNHTSALLNVLDPSIVLLSGTAIRRYQRYISEVVPRAVVVPMLHFAHRKGKEAEETELARVRKEISLRMPAGAV